MYILTTAAHVQKCNKRIGSSRGKEHDVIAVFSPNFPEFAIVFLATSAAGGTITAINFTYTVCKYFIVQKYEVKRLYKKLPAVLRLQEIVHTSPNYLAIFW